MSSLVIRELSSSDRAALEFEFGRMGARSRYQRFFAIAPKLSPHDLELLLGVDHWHHEALIAFSAPPRMPIGTARYIRLQDFEVAEVAVEVVDGWQRRGVATALLEALRERALRAGIRRFTATMLRDNRGAHALTRHLGNPKVTSSAGSIVEIEVRVGA
jgi:GNAT superfamily N-acetyltransferase